MVICSTGPPLTALVALIFGLLLASASQEPYPPPHSQSQTLWWEPRAPSKFRKPWQRSLQTSSRPPPPSPPPLRRPRNPPPSPTPPPLPASINYSPPPPPRKPIQGPQPPAPLLTSKTTRKTPNLGKKLGLSFAGIAVILQFAVAGFLAYKKKQLYNVRD